jgi:cation diffusion facilitator CzcD-associated flavoprotein CzcO
MSAATDPTPLDLLIVGAGFGGLCLLHKARAAGLNVQVIEAAPSVGGTWYHNRYPGARVDVQSLEYSFGFDEALQQEWHWNERYASQPELLRYANHVADRFDLRRSIALNTRLTQAHWDEGAHAWLAVAHTGQRWLAHHLVMATGPLSTPNTPRFEGLDRFEGRVLHTADWPHEAPDFTGQRVGVIGTGSSGVQVIPKLARQAAQLTVFQRTPAYVVPAHNGPLDAAFEARIKADYPGFRARSRAMSGGFGSELPPHPVSALKASAEEREQRFEARWQVGGFAFLGTFYDILLNHDANALAAEFVRNKIRATVQDPATAERLCPDYPIGCKRLCVDSDDYFGTFNRPHVKLVDISDAPIERFTAHGLVTGGQEHAFDSLVLATGFDAITGTLMRLDLRGRGGLRIQDKWSTGPLNYLGLMTAGFPNLYHVAGAGSTSAFTAVTLCIEHHADWILQCIGWLRENGHASIEASEAAESAWMDHLVAKAERTVILSCNSWYVGANIPGKPRRFMALIGGFPAYEERCAQVAACGYEGFVLG